MDIVPANSPPIFLVFATDDPLGLAPASVELCTPWEKKGVPTEMHMYSKGGHGFGMKIQGLPSDS
ncbi:MAG: acetyl esterase/lipase [Sediminicola sp.]|jgi:acetyl esterase/lipase